MGDTPYELTCASDLKLYSRIGITGWKEEMFFSDKTDTDKSDLFERSRAQIGLSFRPVPSLKDLSCNLYYMVQHDMTNHSSTWTPTNVYGLECTWKF